MLMFEMSFTTKNITARMSGTPGGSYYRLSRLSHPLQIGDSNYRLMLRVRAIHDNILSIEAYVGDTTMPTNKRQAMQNKLNEANKLRVYAGHVF